MANPFEKRCEDCGSLIKKDGRLACDECFGQYCADIDDCPLGITAEAIEAIEEKTKDYKLDLNAKSETAKATRNRKPTEDAEKEAIIEDVARYCSEFAENVVISNKTKIIEFDIGENHYKIDLIRQRKPKN